MNKGTFDSEIDEQIILATFNKIDIETNHACVDFLRKYANANDFSDDILKVFSKLIKIEIFYNFLNCFFFVNSSQTHWRQRKFRVRIPLRTLDIRFVKFNQKWCHLLVQNVTRGLNIPGDELLLLFIFLKLNLKLSSFTRSEYSSTNT